MGRRKYEDEQREHAEQRRRFNRCSQQRKPRQAQRALRKQTTEAYLFSGILDCADAGRPEFSRST
jgi:hypothetical protein